MTTTRLERDGGLAVLTLANPPLNQISGPVRPSVGNRRPAPFSTSNTL